MPEGGQQTSDTTITAEERARLHSVLSEHGTPQVEDRIILRLLNTIEQAEARALTWTHEPPKVAGKYWWRDKRHPDEASIVNVTETKLDGYRRDPIGEYEQFAGPIPPPID